MTEIKFSTQKNLSGIMLSEFPFDGERRIFIVSTQPLLAAAGFDAKSLAGAPVDAFSLKADGETCKSLTAAQEVLNELASLEYSKKDILLAAGGGTICDLAGFCAAIYKRGMRLAMLPMSLLAMVDAAVGGKNAVNLGMVKNLAGSFYMPEKVIINPDFLKTLPRAEIENGFFEIFKYALLFSPEMLDGLIRDADALKTYNDENSGIFKSLIEKCAKYKSEIVARDPFDENERLALNLGHTVGHAIESASANGVRHGAAVGAGIFIELMISEKMKVLKDADAVFYKCAAFLKTTCVPEIIMRFASDRAFVGSVARFILNDKKAAPGLKIKMPLIKAAGDFEIAQVDYNYIIREVLSDSFRLVKKWKDHEK